MGVLHTFPATKAHNLAAALLERHSAQEIADAIEVLIDVLDALGGDPDLEDDDPAGQADEDGINTGSNVFCSHGQSFAGPGCVISDDDFAPNWPVPTYGIDQTHIERMPE